MNPEPTPEDMLKHVKLAKLILDLEEDLLGIDPKESSLRSRDGEQTSREKNLDTGHQSFIVLSDF
jgi:hypothetical protein